MINCSSATEPLGKSEGGKEPPSRSIKQFFKLFKFEKLDRQRGEKNFFDTLAASEAFGGGFLCRFPESFVSV